MAKRVAVVGAGVMGLWLSHNLLRRGYEVTLLEKDDGSFRNACSHYAGGMLAPFVELESAEPVIALMGAASMQLLPGWLETLAKKVWFQSTGSLVVAHPRDQAELDRLALRVRTSPLPHDVRECNVRDIMDLEPDLEDRFRQGLFFPHEGQINPRELLPALLEFVKAKGADVHFNTPVDEIQPGKVSCKGEVLQFDQVVDCRGLLGRDSFPQLRGVKGEMILIQTDEVRLHRPVRMMHPRYPLYIVPRPNGVFMIGATSLENESRHTTSVRSVLELLSAAYALHPAFGEATVLELNADARPALPNHLPQVQHTPGLLRINGLYRHGILLSPALAEAVGQFLDGSPTPDWTEEIWRPL